MQRILESFRNAFKIPELRRRLLFTLALMVVYRIGSHIPTPGIDPSALSRAVNSANVGGLMGLYDMFVGGAFLRATVFALGIMPYISASIILQLLGAVVPYFQQLQKEGEEGRKKINQYTRYGTVVLSLAQSWGIAMYLLSLKGAQGSIVLTSSALFMPMTMISLTAGTIFIMWLGEQITEKGIGNGISLIIFIGIVARLPQAIYGEVLAMFELNTRPILTEVVILVLVFLTVAAVVLLTQGTRKVPVQYAKRIVGRKVMGGQSSQLQLRVNQAGVIPIIFAQSIIVIPGTIVSLFPENDTLASIAMAFHPSSVIYNVIYFFAIIFFTYFYTAIIMNPVDMAENLKKHGAFIPGIRPGKKTSEFIDKVLTRITLPGSISLAAIAILPIILMSTMDVTFYLGGTGLLIVVSVALETLAQIESHLIMRHYEGFMRKGRIKGRRY